MPQPPSVRPAIALSDGERLQRSEGRFVRLLLVVLLPILLLPLTANEHGSGPVILAVVISLLVLQSLHTLSRPTSGLRGLMGRGGFGVLALCTLVAIWVPALRGSWDPPQLKMVVLSLLSLYDLVISVRLVQLLAKAPRVNTRVMAGAAAGYLLLGLTGGVLATATQVFVPGSFRLDFVGDHQLLLDRLTYFSFVVIAGLGLGDIVPGNVVGERFVMLLSVASTLYVALLVGLMLGRFIASQEVEYLEEEHLLPQPQQPPRTGDGAEGAGSLPGS